MGHKAGTQHSGAQGIRIPMTANEVTQELEDNEKNEIRVIARKYTKPAIQQLAQIMKNTKYSPGARVSAAKAIIEFGHGKPAQEINRTGEADRKLIINVLKLSPGDNAPIEIQRELEEILSH